MDNMQRFKYFQKHFPECANFYYRRNEQNNTSGFTNSMKVIEEIYSRAGEDCSKHKPIGLHTSKSTYSKSIIQMTFWESIEMKFKPTHHNDLKFKDLNSQLLNICIKPLLKLPGNVVVPHNASVKELSLDFQ